MKTVQSVATGPPLDGNITRFKGDASSGSGILECSSQSTEGALVEVALLEAQIERKMELFQNCSIDEIYSSPHYTQKPMFGFRRRIGDLEKNIWKRTFRFLESLEEAEVEEELDILAT